jgi:hypothetical protein
MIRNNFRLARQPSRTAHSGALQARHAGGRQVAAISRLPKSRAARPGVQCQHSQLTEANRDDSREGCAPWPAPAAPSTEKGRATFASTGCVHCHTPSLKTGVKIASGSSTNPSAALSNQTANLYSDLLVHQMGKGLADGITQGAAGPDEFRTAPLWGVGQRVFFLHDGRTTNLVEAIRDHKSRGSEANKVIERFNRLTAQEQQEVIDFLRSL